MARIISPSLLSADFARLGEQIHLVEEAGAERLHLDVMDGRFVPNITFGPLIVEAIRRLSNCRLDTHLMIEEPHRFLKQFVEAGADTVIVHAEASTDLHRDLATIRELGASPGVAINPDTDFDTLQPYLGELDYLLIMSVFPGFGGQSLIESTLENMRQAAAARKDHGYQVAVDGGINTQTVEQVFATGIDIAVVGSALFKAPDIPQRFRDLQG
ncbi:MAG: ribulose-phosphate 3-epimerase [Fidelibacterota bacterium]|nr:MAG: ribulose-phosphate 3-epimerase [Candidatus Neomarinimicrobiota bacterium]